MCRLLAIICRFLATIAVAYILLPTVGPRTVPIVATVTVLGPTVGSRIYATAIVARKRHIIARSRHIIAPLQVSCFHDGSCYSPRPILRLSAYKLYADTIAASSAATVAAFSSAANRAANSSSETSLLLTLLHFSKSTK